MIDLAPSSALVGQVTAGRYGFFMPSDLVARFKQLSQKSVIINPRGDTACHEAPHLLLADIINSDPFLHQRIDLRTCQTGLLSPAFVGYAQTWKWQINPYDHPLTGICGYAAANISLVLLATNAREIYLVDRGYRWDQDRRNDMFKSLAWPLFGSKYFFGFSFSSRDDLAKGGLLTYSYKKSFRVLIIPYWEALMLELKALGVSEEALADIRLQEDDYYAGKTVTIKFPWNYLGQPPKERILHLLSDDIEKPQDYSLKLKQALDSGIDFYLENATTVFSDVSFVSDIWPRINADGFILTDRRENFSNLELPRAVLIQPSQEIAMWDTLASQLTERLFVDVTPGYGWRLQGLQKST